MTESSDNLPLRRPQALSLSGWLLCGSLAFTLLSLTDLVLSSERPSAVSVTSGLTLSAAVGALVGVVFGLAFSALSARSVRVRRLFWGASGFSAAVGLIIDLGVLARLAGEHRTFALLALAGSLFMGLSLSVVALLRSPTVERPRGHFGEFRPLFLWTSVAALALVSAVTVWMDRTFLPEGYLSAHVALRLTSLLGLMFAFSIALSAPLLTRRSKVLFGATFGVPFLLSASALGNEEKAVRILLEGPHTSIALTLARGLTDFDVDGYSSFLGGGDCAPLDSSVNPGEEEIPDNQMDDNCIGGDARRRVIRADELKWPDVPPTRSVVLITVDTVSALRMSLYGAKRDTTPNLKEWAKGATVFRNAYTTGGWTSLAVSSLHRGMYPRKLTWTRLFETTNWRLLTRQESKHLEKGESIKMMFGMPLLDPHVPLAVWLKRRGLYTAAVINDGQSEFLDPKYMSEGFDMYRDLDEIRRSPSVQPSDAQVTQAALAALHQMPKDRPFFLWVHYFGPHLGNSRHASVPKFGSTEADRYDHEIAYMDEQVSRLLTALDRTGKSRDLAVILTSDHGEFVHETGRGHGRFLHEAGIRVPLVVKAKGFRPGRYKPIASIVDIYPTVLALTGAPIPANLDGIDLREVVSGSERAKSRVLMTETWRYARSGRRISDSVAAFDGKLKLTLELVTRARSLRKQGRREDISENLLGEPDYEFEHLEDALAEHLDYSGSAEFKN